MGILSTLSFRPGEEMRWMSWLKTWSLESLCCMFTVHCRKLNPSFCVLAKFTTGLQSLLSPPKIAFANFMLAVHRPGGFQNQSRPTRGSFTYASSPPATTSPPTFRPSPRVFRPIAFGATEAVKLQDWELKSLMSSNWTVHNVNKTLNSANSIHSTFNWLQL
jgi:hypothetical protein